MNSIDYLLMALAAPRGGPMRSLLTRLGIVFGVASLIAMMAIGLIVADRCVPTEVA